MKHFVVFFFFLHKSASERTLLAQKTTFYENCTHLDDVVQIVRNADARGRSMTSA